MSDHTLLIVHGLKAVRPDDVMVEREYEYLVDNDNTWTHCAHGSMTLQTKRKKEQHNDEC